METVHGIFDVDVYNLPTFEELDSNIEFQHLFLHNLIGSDYDCVKKFYDRIGEKLKKYFIDSNVISNDTCPRAYTITILYKPLSGWIILTNLLKGRLVACGAAPDFDLDAQRCSLILREGDTLSGFFQKTQQLFLAYAYQYKSIKFVPSTKLKRTYLNQLQCVPAYIPYLVEYYNIELINHIKQFGEHNNYHNPSFSIKDVYDRLSSNRNLPQIITRLLPNNNIISDSIKPMQEPSTSSSSAAQINTLATEELRITTLLLVVVTIVPPPQYQRFKYFTISTLMRKAIKSE